MLLFLALALVLLFVFDQWLLWEQRKAFHQREREWTQERDKLLQRIQAPERAVIEDFEPQRAVDYVPFDDDVAYWANKEELNG